ncbi:MAG: hypothetical protein NTZ42_04040 [Candidatus Gribaldobacteria bacterium]|nr:hypothetical protein [Candidatus Gribaldobacteria bacterium]
MDKKSKIFFVVFFFLVLVATGLSFYKYFILKDYYIKAEAACDPQQEKCFMIESDSGEGTSYYKLVKKKARDIPLCEVDSPDCPALACQVGEDCQEVFCDETTKPEGVECTNPATFQ